MATTHVFIVDYNTLKYHLEYQFAGTGAREEYIDFNSCPTCSLYAQTENNLVSMLADSQRVRVNDNVIFYLQQNAGVGIFEGKLYGIFKVKEAPSFLDNNDEGQFLKDELKKSLTFRTILEPSEVFPKGVTEWEALDEIKNIRAPNQMLWSLIYRKLKGNRGNTMITAYESDRLCKLIRNKSGNSPIRGTGFTFNVDTQGIEASELKKYSGEKVDINILPRLLRKSSEEKVFETHLQAHIIQYIGRTKNKNLDDLIIGDLELEWIGNEVSCGVGMQRIDVLLSLLKGDVRIVMPIELKATTVSENNLNQLQRYVDWLEQYYVPNMVSDIHPVLLTKETKDKTNRGFGLAMNRIIQFNEDNKNCLPLKYIEFRTEEDDIVFKDFKYNT